MDNEKLRVLKMLEEGRITADEAARLLDAGGKTPNPSDKPQSNDSGGTKPSGGLEEYANDLSQKFETFAKDWEPKLQKFTEIVVEKTMNVAEKISQSMEQSKTERPGTVSSGAAKAQEHNFDIRVAPGYNELNLSGFNGNVSVKGYNGDKITARVACKAKRFNASIQLIQLGSKYTLQYDENEFETVSIDAYVPEQLFNTVCIRTVNGKIDASSLNTEQFQSEGSNGETIVSGISSQNLMIDSNNGKLILSDIVSKNGQIDNFNGDITIQNVDVENLSLTTSNGGISMIIGQYHAFSEYVWAIDTSNGKLGLTLPSSPQYGYHLKAHTSLGMIKMGLVGLNFLTNDASNMEVKSINFDHASKHIRMSLETTNAPIVVN